MGAFGSPGLLSEDPLFEILPLKDEPSPPHLVYVAPAWPAWLVSNFFRSPAEFSWGCCRIAVDVGSGLVERLVTLGLLFALVPTPERW
jgi:hypothetical protein